MAVLQMQKLCICALKKDRKSLMEFLQAAGVLELSAEAEPDEVYSAARRQDTAIFTETATEVISTLTAQATADLKYTGAAISDTLRTYGSTEDMLTHGKAMFRAKSSRITLTAISC